MEAVKYLIEYSSYLNSVLIVISFIFGTITSIIALCSNGPKEEKFFKASGIFLVFILSVMANSAWVIAVSIFIIATIIRAC